MLKRRICSRKKSVFESMNVLMVKPSFIQINKQRVKCIIKKKCCKKRVRRKRCFPIFPRPPRRCHSRRPCPRPWPRPCPIPPCVDPISRNTIVEKECCGNLLIQGNQTEFPIWENDGGSNIKVVQITIYSSPTSTDPLDVEIVGTDTKQMHVPPGNTINYIGHDIKSVKVSAAGNEFKYVEGKFVISTTIELHHHTTTVNEQ